MKPLFRLLACLSVVLALSGPFISTGQTTTEPYSPPDLPINTALPIPNEVPISGPNGQGPAGIIANFYSFAFLVAGFLAFIMIVYGGVRYTFSAGNHSWKEEGKEAIRQALFGLGLLLVAYLILRTINPDLTQLKLPTLAPYNPPVPAPVGGEGSEFPCGTPPTGRADGSCPAGATCQCAGGGLGCQCSTLQSTCAAADLLTPLLPDGQAIENGDKIVWTSTNSNIQKNLTALKAEYQKLFGEIHKAGGNVSPNSVYRPHSYQRHLWEICDRFKKLQGTMGSGPATSRSITYGNTDSGCTALEGAITTEIRKHAINSGCVVAAPEGCGTHTTGTGMDLTITGISSQRADQLAQAAGIHLRWRKLSNDEFHWQLVADPDFAIPAPGCIGSF